MTAVFEPNTRVLITGATSGLGRELARQLGARKCRLAITGRRRENLEDTATIARDAGAADVVLLLGTVTDLDVVHSHYAEIRERFGGLDVAILNAGVGDSRHSTQFTAQEYRWTFDTNLFGCCNWIEVMLPDMLGAKTGVIVGVASPAAWRGFPGTGSYSSSKAALATMLESIRVDLRDSGVDVITIFPGFVKSELTARNDPKEMIGLLDTEEGVRRMIRGIERRNPIIHFPRRLTSLIRHLIRPMPVWLFDRLASRYLKRHKEPYVDQSADSLGTDDAPASAAK